MNDNNVQDVTWLLDFSKQWLGDHPGEQIPLDLWSKQFEKVKYGSDSFVIYDYEYSVTPGSLNLIPALAAITLGMKSNEIVKALKHHNVLCNHISQTTYDLVYESESKSPPELEALALSSWNVNKNLIDAIMKDKDMSHSFSEEYRKYGINYEMEIAWLLCDHAPFWPDTFIRQHLEEVSKGAIYEQRELFDATSSYAFSNTSFNFNDISDEKILTILERSGNLTYGLTSENGFYNTHAFFRDLLMIMDDPDSKNYNVEKVFEAINGVEIGDASTKIKDRIIESICQRNHHIENGANLFKCMNKVLDRTRYGSISKDLVLNLNILNISSISKNKSIDIFEGNSFEGNSLAASIGISSEAVAQQLYLDLKNIKTDEFRRPHFDAVDKLLRYSEIKSESIERTCIDLLLICLKGLDVYRETPRYPGEDTSRDMHLEIACKDLQGLIAYSAKAKCLDYKAFGQFSSESKALLASNGFDIRRLPGMTSKHRGQVLSDQLGL
jgi:hypothetical protein